MRYQTIVIDAGIVGTSIAWHLQKNNSKVLLLDKNLPGAETSYGNAGLIQFEAIHVRPFPRQLTQLVKVIPNRRVDIRYRLPAVLRHHQALLQYWKYSAPSSVKQIEKEWQTLIAHGTSEHQAMIIAAGADDLIRRSGWIELHRTKDHFKIAIASASSDQAYGIEHKVLTIDKLQTLEPNGNFDEFVGAIHWFKSWQVVNPSALVNAYAKSFVAMAGDIKQNAVKEITLDNSGDIHANGSSESRGWQVVTDSETYHCDDLVIAAGPWSNQLIKPLGYDLPLFPMRGYHQHFQVTEQNAINHSMIDMDKGFVIGPMQQGIRITTGAEMTTMDAAKNFGQLQAALQFANQIIPLQTAVEKEAWAGSRPCMPDMKPVIGAAGKHDNLWFAFGHAHNGLTLGPVTGRLIEELIHDKPTLIDVEPFSAQRFFA